MQKIYCVFVPTGLQQMLSKLLVLSTLSLTGLISGTLGWSSQVAAQTLKVNNTEIRNYAQAVLAMEPARQEALEKIKKLIGGKEVPKIVCHESKTIDALPNNIRDIAVNYCNKSQKIVEANGLTSDLFNKITMEIPNNNTLKQQIYNILLELQKKP
ncbi:DUF4168 domain-containing protein [Cronbergia sp. UHCC 0137]|uniref:DUF4168 domain-containing protein n=1 Tax=Cronbergia sp. UHCC 0137 TaxID=3110239 RepID=UPI002B213FEA|nr:DUF4168 domain-containing protein [Cronbergia sp. UHCC 0137]MEA5617878.1 DUF4168 domain-containing protein [Cronbergia sp. UHCC 0137]